MVPITLSDLYCYITLFLRITRPAIVVPNNHTTPGTGTDDGVVLTQLIPEQFRPKFSALESLRQNIHGHDR